MRYVQMFIVLVCLVVISGCFEFHVTQEIHPDGSGSIIIMYDFSDMAQMIRDMNDDPDDGSDELEQFDAACDEIDISMLINPTCTSENYVVTFGGSLGPGTIPVTVRDDEYELAIKDLYDVINAITEDWDGAEPLDDESLRESRAVAQMINMKMTLVVIMDGPVLSADVGTIQDNMVTINFLDLPRYDTPRIVAQTSPARSPTLMSGGLGDIGQWGFLGGIALVVLGLLSGIIIFVVMRHKHPPVSSQPVAAATPSDLLTPTQQTLVEWIRQYRSEYSDQRLKEVLTQQGYSAEDIDVAFTHTH